MNTHSNILTHRFVYTTATGEQSAELLEFQNDEAAILCARSLLSADLIAVGVQRHEGDRGAERVGLWLWRRDGPVWKPGE